MATGRLDPSLEWDLEPPPEKIPWFWDLKFMFALVPDIIFQVSTLQQSNHELENCPPKN